MCSEHSTAGGKLRVHECFESFNFRSDGLTKRIFADDSVGGLQAVAGNAHDGGFFRRDTALIDQLFCDAGGDAACGFRKDAFSFSQNLYGGNNFRIGNIFRPAAGLAN